jgi:hypothetical protein
VATLVEFGGYFRLGLSWVFIDSGVYLEHLRRRKMPKSR